MGKIVKSTSKDGQVQYPVTLDKAVVCGGLYSGKVTLEQKIAELYMLSKYAYHDQAAFCNYYTPSYYTSADGVNFTSATLDKEIFCQKDFYRKNALTDEVVACRWVINHNNLRYSYLECALFGVEYSPERCHADITIEVSGDGTTWNTVFHGENYYLQAQFIYAPFSKKIDTESYLRITLKKHDIAESGNFPLATLRLLTRRVGAQGLGGEYEKPYRSNADRAIYPWVANTQNLGTSSCQWNAVFGKTLFENGKALSAIYAAKTDVANTYPTKTDVSNTYATKTDVDDLSERIDNLPVNTGSTIAIFPKLTINDEGELKITCPKGQILNTDTFVFGRYITTKIHYTKEGETDVYKKKRGWITPKYTSNITVNAMKERTGSLSEDTWVVTINSLSPKDYEAWREIRKNEMINPKSFPLSLQKKCGIAIFRGDKRISEYMPFKVVCHIDRYITSRC